ncbi:uncharacterized protein BDR25DRAFT_98018 [Lindgomyces ingoldianus]|uniref:Uncharacterized protein n=1 Tax=Lindgomyces ingoldianus TaxID=673940 RepID=A0ACB6QBG5_9PLEO|nr:uncharacterized protein BDR25DRAFT_98018 [Lindgomyces ingoldianus]KAF2464283.1 hypothetical protein BDR25DRAFT_98018 [Lindgomyces ingoldianus]
MVCMCTPSLCTLVSPSCIFAAGRQLGLEDDSRRTLKSCIVCRLSLCTRPVPPSVPGDYVLNVRRALCSSRRPGPSRESPSQNFLFVAANDRNFPHQFFRNSRRASKEFNPFSLSYV